MEHFHSLRLTGRQGSRCARIALYAAIGFMGLWGYCLALGLHIDIDIENSKRNEKCEGRILYEGGIKMYGGGYAEVRGEPSARAPPRLSYRSPMVAGRVLFFVVFSLFLFSWLVFRTWVSYYFGENNQRPAVKFAKKGITGTSRVPTLPFLFLLSSAPSARLHAIFYQQISKSSSTHGSRY